jgi:serine/threonine-protein kinase
MRERVGPYRLIKRLGGGGMGEVFEALHEQLQRRVAIKFLHQQLCSHPQVAARFLNEARAVNIVRHSCLVDIYDVGQLDDGSLYIVMELLDGDTLSRRIRGAGMLSADEATRLGRQIASALAAAHARGIIHRDLKPDNVMLIADPEVEGGMRVKVLDFGIAKMLGPTGNTPTAQLTHTGFILGTPQYMAPEQCRGSRDIDGKADVYALGLILYEALIGTPAFSGTSEWELMAAQIQQAAPLLPPRVRPHLASLITRMLEKESQARPTMADVAARLGDLRGGDTPWTPPAERMTLPANNPYLTPVPAPSRTTLGSAASELSPSPARSRSLLWLWVAVPLVGGGAAWLARAMTTPLAPPPPPPVAAVVVAPPPIEAKASPAPTVAWTVTSLPSGASIDRTDDGAHLGETPWHREQPAAAGAITVRLTRPGYRSREVMLDLGHDEHRQVQLKRRNGDSDEVQTVH